MRAPVTPRDLDLDDPFSLASFEAISARRRTPEIAPPPPPPPEAPADERQQLGVRISKSVYKRLRRKALEDEVLLQDLVERAIAELLAQEGG